MVRFSTSSRTSDSEPSGSLYGEASRQFAISKNSSTVPYSGDDVKRYSVASLDTDGYARAHGLGRAAQEKMTRYAIGAQHLSDATRAIWNTAFMAGDTDDWRAAFDEKSPDIRYRMAEVANDAPYGVRVATLGNAIRNGAYDMFVNYQGPLFRAYRAITKGKQVDDAYNVEAASKNVHGKIRAKIESVEHRYLEPLMDIIKQNNLDADRLDDYLYAKFAPERNAMIAARTAVVDPETGELVAMEEDGSGMSNERARALMARLASDPILIASILSTLPNAPLLR